MQIQRMAFSEVYEKLLEKLLFDPEYIVSPRGMEVREITNITLKIMAPEYFLYENEKRGSQLKYIAAELLWYFTGDRNKDFITKYAKFWEHISDENGNVNSAYGNLLFVDKNEHGISEWEWALNQLKSDKDTRQGIVRFNKPKHSKIGNKDFVCTMYGNFNIRDNKLNFSVKMRSNDAILGLPTDFAFFSLLQQEMLFHLKETYPDLKLGSYTHSVDSMHIYERHFSLVTEMLKHKFKPYGHYIKQDEFFNFINTDGSPTETTSELYKLANGHSINALKNNSKLIAFIKNNLK